MGYWSVSEIAEDADIRRRITAAYAVEGDVKPAQSAYDNIYRLAASPGWGAAWASAVAAGVSRPGRDEAVITDSMILSAVQALRGGVH